MNTQQGSPAWFAARQGKLTASRFGAAAGIGYESRRKCLRIAIGKEEWKGNNLACTWGTQNEKNAVKDYMVRTGNVVTHRGFYEHPVYPWLGGSPDGLVGERGLIEVKCPFIKKECHLHIPPTYYCQINGLMEILDKDWCDFVSWTPTEMKIYRVYRDPELFDYLLDRYCIFYAFMKRGCDAVPRVTSAEKQDVLTRIAKSDETHCFYHFWEALEPGNLRGQWDAPPDFDAFDVVDTDDCSTSGESPSSKRKMEDDTTSLCTVQRLEESATGICPANADC